jgi:anti-anti-sigma regulatory factor
MVDTNLQVTARSSTSEGLVLAVEGYLDENGCRTLARETQTTPLPDQRHIRFDLHEVCLFNCSGARQFITLLNDLERLGYEVDLVGVHPPLQRLLDISS